MQTHLGLEGVVVLNQNLEVAVSVLCCVRMCCVCIYVCDHGHGNERALSHEVHAILQQRLQHSDGLRVPCKWCEVAPADSSEWPTLPLHRSHSLSRGLVERLSFVGGGQR
jgi:hypothetical protein